MTVQDSSLTPVTMVSALNASLHDAMSLDGRTMLIGEDIGNLGGVFRVTDGLLTEFGSHRVIDSPLGEAGIVGTAVGLAMCGYRPICEIQFDGFSFTAMNQITTQLARMHHRSQGVIRMPVVIRIPVAGGIGAIEHHSESPETYFAHTPGLRVVSCSTPQNSYGLLRAAIASDDPVVFLEPKSRYWERGIVDRSTAEDIGSARLVRAGDDVLLITYGACLRLCLEAAVRLGDLGISTAVLDLRSLAPLDSHAILTHMQPIGRAVVVHEASQTLGVGAEITALILENAFFTLQAPVLRVTGYDTPYPPSRLEHWWLPNVERVQRAVYKVMSF